MSLEIRIETLEHELKILKNEIENTLLEIQNQVLIHYYPSLRAENSAPPKDLSSLLASPSAEKKDEAQGKGNGSHRSAGDEVHPPPKTKEVSLNEIGAKPKHAPIPPATGDDSQQTPDDKSPWSVVRGGLWVPSSPQTAFTHLAKWVSDAVEKIGKERTEEMIESHASAEYCTPEIKDLLLQFVLLSEEENPPDQVETTELMDVLLKLNKVLHQVGRAAETPTRLKERSVG